MRTTARTPSALLALVAALAFVTASGPSPGLGDERLDGQAVLDLDASQPGVDTGEAVFDAPAGRASVVVSAVPGTRGTLLVNGRAVPEAAAALRAGGTREIDLDRYSDAGENRLAASLSRGAARLAVPFTPLTPGSPDAVGMDEARLAELDALLAGEAGPEPEDRFAGAVLLVARHGVVVKHDAYGHAQTYDGAQPLPQPRRMTPDTVFDLASITKVAATTAALMRLVDERRVDLDAPAASWIPELSGGGKEAITVRQLLTHRSGMWEWQPLYLHARNADDALARVAGLELRYGVGEQRRYSDLGFMLLGEIVARASGQPLEDYVARAVHGRLGMTDTTYRPAAGAGQGIAATSFGNPFEYRMIETGSPYPVEGHPDDFDGWRDHTLVGEANDGNAFYAFEGVAGHAGLFGSARDLAVFGQMLVNGGGYGTARLASPGIVEEFTRDQVDAGQALGFWTNRLAVAGGSGGVGHGGFTGTEVLADPDSGLVVVLLTNRQHPDEPYASIFPVWRQVLAGVLDATTSPSP